jgi:hypothetical protein
MTATSTSTTTTGGGRTQFKVPTSVSNSKPSGVVQSAQFNPTTTVTSANTGDLIGAATHSIGDALSGAWHGVTSAFSNVAHKAENAIFGTPAEQRAAEQRVHDVTSPKTTVITPGHNNTGRIDPISGYPIGKWAWNQDNSGGAKANWYENANGKDEYGNKTTAATGFHLKPGQVFTYNGMKVTQDDFEKEKGTNEWDDWKPVKDVVPDKTITTQGLGANQQYQLGMQGTANGGSFQLGSALTANNAAVSGRASGALTQGGWTQGAASGNSSGGASGTANFVNNGGGVSSSGSSIVQTNPSKVYMGK